MHNVCSTIHTEKHAATPGTKSDTPQQTPQCTPVGLRAPREESKHHLRYMSCVLHSSHCSLPAVYQFPHRLKAGGRALVKPHDQLNKEMGIWAVQGSSAPPHKGWDRRHRPARSICRRGPGAGTTVLQPPCVARHIYTHVHSYVYVQEKPHVLLSS